MKNGILIILLALILAGIYWSWFLPGPRAAADFPVVSSSALKPLLNIPQLWSEYGAEGLGEYTVFTLWSWPFVVVSSVLANFGIGFELRERVLIILPFLILGFWGMWSLGKELKFSNTARFISTLFYLANSYILTVLDGGQLTIGLAYAIFPISFLAIKRSIQGRIKSKILAGFSLWIIGFLDFRFTYVMILLALFYFIFELLFLKSEKINEWIIGWFKTGMVLGLMLIGLNVYWLIPIFKVPLSTNEYSRLIQTDFASYMNLGHSMLLLSPHWFTNVFGVITKLRFEFIFIIILVFIAPVLRPKSKTVGFWLILALISIFLTKGASPPFDNIYQWLYLHIPGFSLFRDSTKFFFLTAISYAVLLGITVDEIQKRMKAKIILPLILTALIIFTSRPAWSGLMTGMFSFQPLEGEYAKLNKYFKSNKKFSRVFWIPTIAPLASLNPLHPFVEASRFVQQRPFAQGTLGTYEIFNFLREAPYMGEIFDVFGISYIAYPNLNPRRDNLHPDNIKYYQTFSSQLTKLPWLEKVAESQIPLWQTKSSQDKFFIAPNLWWVIGSDDIYKESTKSAKMKLSKNALIFAEEKPEIGKRLDEFEDARIILNNKTQIDLAASFVDSKDLIFPAINLNYDPDFSGWWKRETKDLIAWRYFLRDKYSIDNQDFDLGGGWAVGEGNLELRIKNYELRKDKILLARVMESSRSGNLKFYQDDRLVGEVSTKVSENTNVRWFEVGKLKNSNDISINSDGEINVVNALSLLDQDKWDTFKSKAVGLQSRVVNFNEISAENLNPRVAYKEITSTKYKITVTDLIQPSFLVFSQTFHPLWVLNGKGSMPIYSLLNGFSVDKNGEYILEFEPQKAVLAYFLISGFTLLISIWFLLKKGKLY